MQQKKPVRRSHLARPPKIPAIAVDLKKIKDVIFCTSEAAKYLGLSINTMRKYCQDGYFANADRFGNEWMIPRHDVYFWETNRKGKLGRPS